MKFLTTLVISFCFFMSCFSQPSAPCGDTSKRVQIGGYMVFAKNQFIFKTSDNSFIIPTPTSANYTPTNLPVALTKVGANGNINWTRTYTVSVKSVINLDVSIDIYKGKELANGDLLFSMSTNYNISTRSDFILMRITSAGNLVWAKSFKSTLWTNSSQGNCRVASLEEDSLGNLYIAGEQKPFNATTDAFILKLSGKGQILWDKTFRFITPSQTTFGLVAANNELNFLGKYINPVDGIGVVWGMRINSATGDTIATKFLKPSGNSTTLRTFIDPLTVVKLNSGNIAITGNAFNFPSGIDTFYHTNVAVFTPQLSYVNGFTISSKMPSDSVNSMATTYANGKTMYTRSRKVGSSGFYEIIYGSVVNNKIIKERLYKSTVVGTASTTNFLNMNGNKDIILHGSGQLAIMSDYDSSVSCNGNDTLLSFIQPLQYLPYTANFNNIFSNSIVETGRTFSEGSFDLATSKTICQQVTKCNSLKLRSDTNSFCSSTLVTIKAKKNSGCNNPVIWNYPSSVASVLTSNDSTLTLRFNTSWQGKIYASINACTTVTDSVQIAVSSSPGPVNLGNDTTLCNGSSFVLRSGRLYKSYLWQDGSKDSTYTVTSPGMYYVSVIDSCNNFYKDTVIIAADIPVNFDLGADKIRCNNDTLTLIAPTGFNSYQWTPFYNLSSATSQSVKAFPDYPTTYTVTAKKSNGCLVTDSIRVNKRFSPGNKNLGKDTVLCNNGSLTLSAGSKYLHYQWNNGSTDSLLTITKAGNYSIIVTDSCNNIYYDTIIVSTDALVSFDVGPDKTKCNHDSIVLTAPAGFNNYQWTPSLNLSSPHSQTTVAFPITTTSYKVVATTVKGCPVADSLKLFVNVSSPINLGNDTSFCTSDSIIITAPAGFLNYSWSNGATTSTIIAKSAGVYYLRATDVNTCSSFDTLVVNQLFPLPNINLGNDTAICRGSNYLINVPGYTNYLWQNGSHTAGYNITQPGIYWLKATDQNKCVSSDTLIITGYKEPSFNFLPAHDSICKYQKILLKASINLINYHWNDGSTNAFLEVKAPGIYWLNATNSDGCNSTDSTIVLAGQCNTLVYFPNAFTPNADGKNDYFRPKIFGSLETFSLQIYNRYGKRVFESKDVSSGWNGKINGTDQGTGSYIWICNYKFFGANEKTQIQKGTVVLIR